MSRSTLHARTLSRRIIVWTAALAAALILTQPVFAQEAAWVRTGKIAAFDGRFGYEAYANRVVVIDNATGAREAVRAGAQSAIGASFKNAFAGDASLSGKLGPALSPEVAALAGKLRVQVFRNGAMLYEPNSRTTWWGWHSRTRNIGSQSTQTPSTQTPSTPTTPNTPAQSTLPSTPPTEMTRAAIVDETGAMSQAEAQMLLGALREFKARHGITVGLVFLNPMSQADGQAKAKTYRQQMVAQGTLGQNSALFALRDESSYTWQCDTRVLEKVSFEQVRYAWSLTSNTTNRPELARQFLSQLSQLLGGRGPIGTAITSPSTSTPPTTPPVSTPPVIPPVTAPVTTTPVSLNGSTPAAVLPGAIMAEKRIGPSGGKIVVPGQVTVEFPPGALQKEERVAVRRSQANNPDLQMVFVERDGGSTLLAKPARVSFVLPAKVSPADALATQEISDGIWIICPSSYDAATRTFTVEVTHFSGAGWFNKENCIRAVGGAITAFGTCVVWMAAAGAGVVAAIPAAIGVGTVAVIFAVGAVGAAASNPVYDYYQRMGLDGVITLGTQPNATDWVIRWNSNDYSLDSMVTTIAFDKTGRMLTAFPGRVTKDQVFATLSAKGFEHANLASQMENVQTIPRKIFIAAWSAMKTRQYYFDNNYNPPGTVEMLIDKNLSKSKENERHLGEWDEKFLRIHTSVVQKVAISDSVMLPENRDELLATIAHEYWHVIFFARGYKNTTKFSWLDESLATAMESEVGVGYENSFQMYQASTVALQFERGLLNFNDPYCAWPLCKYLLHKKDGAYLTDVARGRFDAVAWGGVDGLFANFVRSLLIKEQALDDPIATSRGAVRSGWKGLEPSDWIAAQAANTTRGYLKLGANSFSSRPPLSYSLRRVTVNATGSKPAAPGLLVVRRKTPEMSELYFALKPEFAGSAARVGERRTAGDVRQSVGGVWTPLGWTSKPNSMVPIGLVNTAAQAGSDEPMLAYLLSPPSEITSTPAAGNVTLRWKLPEMGEGLKPAEALRGYRVFYKTKDGREVMVPDLLIKPDLLTFTVPASAMPGFVEVGLASEDAVMRDGNGEYLRSPLSWPEAAGGVVRVTVNEPKPDDLGGYGPMDVLGGKPMPGVEVVCEYVEKGKPVRREATTDKAGRCSFANVPLNVEIKISAQGKTNIARCTAEKPQAFVAFGWQGHEITIDKSGDTGTSSAPEVIK